MITITPTLRRRSNHSEGPGNEVVITKEESSNEGCRK